MKILSILLVVLCLAGCNSTQVTQEVLDNIKTVGIINNMPDDASFYYFGPTVYEVSPIPGGITYKNYASEVAINFYRERGLLADFVNHESQLSDYDMVVKLKADFFYDPGHKLISGYGVTQIFDLIYTTPAFAFYRGAIFITINENGHSRKLRADQRIKLSIESIEEENLPLTDEQLVEIDETLKLSLIHISSPRDKRQSRMPSSA